MLNIHTLRRFNKAKTWNFCNSKGYKNDIILGHQVVSTSSESGSSPLPEPVQQRKSIVDQWNKYEKNYKLTGKQESENELENSTD